MSNEEITFILSCEEEFLMFIRKMSDMQNVRFFDIYQDKIRKSLAGAFLQIMEDYIRYYDSSDENFFNEETFRKVLRHYNNILETNLYIE